MQKTSVLYPPFLNGSPQLIANANLDTHDVRIYKFHKMLVTNCRGRISPRFCNNSSKHRIIQKYQLIEAIIFSEITT